MEGGLGGRVGEGGRIEDDVEIEALKGFKDVVLRWLPMQSTFALNALTCIRYVHHRIHLFNRLLNDNHYIARSK